MKNEKNDLYTLGIWHVKPGMQDDFIHEWASFAEWSNANTDGTGKAYLLQDRKDSLLFISFGSWNDETSINAWRETEGFQAFVVKVKALCDDFEPHTMDVMATSR